MVVIRVGFGEDRIVVEIMYAVVVVVVVVEVIVVVKVEMAAVRVDRGKVVEGTRLDGL